MSHVYTVDVDMYPVKPEEEIPTAKKLDAALSSSFVWSDSTAGLPENRVIYSGGAVLTQGETPKEATARLKEMFPDRYIVTRWIDEEKGTFDAEYGDLARLPDPTIG